MTALWDKLQEALEEREDRLYAAVQHVLQALDTAWLHAQVRARADKLRKSKRFSDSARWLTLLKDSAGLGRRGALRLRPRRAQVAQALARGHRAPLATRRVETFRALGNSPFPLADRLRRERVLEPEDLYFVAFNLAEERDEPRRSPRELLEHLGSKYGRTKVGKAAKNKLQLVPG